MFVVHLKPPDKSNPDKISYELFYAGHKVGGGVANYAVINRVAGAGELVKHIYPDDMCGDAWFVSIGIYTVKQYDGRVTLVILQ